MNATYDGLLVRRSFDSPAVKAKDDALRRGYDGLLVRRSLDSPAVKAKDDALRRGYAGLEVRRTSSYVVVRLAVA